MGQNSAIHICDFSNGCYRVRSPSGKQSLDFEDSDRFGPSKVDMRTGDLSEIPEKSWFWAFYTPWREGGRPVTGEPISTPHGTLLTAEIVNESDQPSVASSLKGSDGGEVGT